MPIYCWILGDKRAVPENFKHVVINEARIDWRRGGANYQTDVVPAAVREAGGQAFVTEYAGSTANVPTYLRRVDEFDLPAVKTKADPVDFIRVIGEQGYFPAFMNPSVPAGVPGDFLAFMSRYVPRPPELSDVSDYDFYYHPEKYRRWLPPRVDTARAVDELRETIVAPNQDARELIGRHPYMTGLFTTMSPADMSQDPTFVFNATLPEVSAYHSAVMNLRCERPTGQVPVDISLASGLSYVPAFDASGNLVLPKVPAALRVEQLVGQGAPAVIVDNLPVIKAALEATTPRPADPANQAQAAPTPSPVARAAGFGCAGCAQTNAPPPPMKQGAAEGATYGMLFLGFWGYRRRLDHRTRHK
jgi:hypothetical protein